MGRTITGTTRGCKLNISGIQDAGHVITQLGLQDAEGVLTLGVKEIGH